MLSLPAGSRRSRQGCSSAAPPSWAASLNTGAKAGHGCWHHSQPRTPQEAERLSLGQGCAKPALGIPQQCQLWLQKPWQGSGQCHGSELSAPLASTKPTKVPGATALSRMLQPPCPAGVPPGDLPAGSCHPAVAVPAHSLVWGQGSAVVLPAGVSHCLGSWCQLGVLHSRAALGHLGRQIVLAMAQSRP